MKLVNRIGNKATLADKITPLMPQHNTYIEPFFGAGGMFFNKKPVAKYNILNDLDAEIHNLFDCYINHNEELYEAFSLVPYSESLWNEYKMQCPVDKVWRAVRFIFLSNFGYLGKDVNLRFEPNNYKSIALQNIKAVGDFLKKHNIVAPSKKDYALFLDSIHFSSECQKKNVFVYCDPPYVETSDNYSTQGFTIDCHAKLQAKLIEFGAKFMISEFAHKQVIELANQNNLNVTFLGERQTVKNRNIEILITNYKTHSLF